MSHGKTRKTAFEPALERAEARIMAAGGLVGPSGHHGQAAPAHVQVQARHGKFHAPKPTRQPSPHPTHDPGPPVISPAIPPRPPAVTNAGGEAWVKFVNMTGADVTFRISLYPYAQGAFLTETIHPTTFAVDAMYLESGLSVGKQTVAPAFQIQFGDAAPVPLMVGASRATAQGYYIFQDSQFRDYIAPFKG